jgi:hypothetical protein
MRFDDNDNAPEYEDTPYESVAVDPRYVDDSFDAAAAFDAPISQDADDRRISARPSGNDPTFGFLVATALNVGLTPLIPANGDLRLVLVWGVLAFFGVLAWLLGNTTRIDEEEPENLSWGIIFGLIVSIPMLLMGGETLTTTVQLIFQTSINDVLITLPRGAILALLVFVMPLSETLFFRGIMQMNRPFWLVGLMASVWSILLFFPAINVGAFPFVAVIIGTALVLMNMIYGYVRQRNGLAAAWLCQIIVNIVVLFVPLLTV